MLLLCPGKTSRSAYAPFAPFPATFLSFPSCFKGLPWSSGLHEWSRFAPRCGPAPPARRVCTPTSVGNLGRCTFNRIEPGWELKVAQALYYKHGAVVLHPVHVTFWAAPVLQGLSPREAPQGGVRRCRRCRGVRANKSGAPRLVWGCVSATRLLLWRWRGGSSLLGSQQEHSSLFPLRFPATFNACHTVAAATVAASGLPWSSGLHSFLPHLPGVYANFGWAETLFYTDSTLPTLPGRCGGWWVDLSPGV